MVRWDLPVLMALCTGMRWGELLNCTWLDIDLEAETLTVSPKEDAHIQGQLRANEFEVMKLAGHSNFSTTHRFYPRGPPSSGTFPFIFPDALKYDVMIAHPKRGSMS